MKCFFCRNSLVRASGSGDHFFEGSAILGRSPGKAEAIAEGCELEFEGCCAGTGTGLGLVPRFFFEKRRKDKESMRVHVQQRPREETERGEGGCTAIRPWRIFSIVSCTFLVLLRSSSIDCRETSGNICMTLTTPWFCAKAMTKSERE